jgi:hypothetical protein
VKLKKVYHMGIPVDNLDRATFPDPAAGARGKGLSSKIDDGS